LASNDEPRRSIDLQIYYFETPNPRKLCAVARYLDLLVEFIHVDLSRAEQKSAAFHTVNPNGRVSALVDGDFRLCEPHAVMIYLAQKAGSDLWPSGLARQVEVNKRTAVGHGTLFPPSRPSVVGNLGQAGIRHGRAEQRRNRRRDCLLQTFCQGPGRPPPPTPTYRSTGSPKSSDGMRT
jgi:glutathione S-transferase